MCVQRWGGAGAGVGFIVLCVAGLGVAASQPLGAAGADPPSPEPPRSEIFEVPFGPGEKSQFQVRLGALPVGKGTMEIVGLETVAGHATYRARLHVAGGIPLARVNTRMESWLDVHGLFSRRFEQDQHELRFRRHRTFDFYPESRTYRQRETGEVRPLASDRPLDDVSFLYFARTLPLQVGDTYTLHRYFREDGNPVVLTVLRRETITVPAGTFNTVVVQPTIQTEGIFGQGGRAEVFFTDDERRLLVQLRSRIPLVGSLSLHLESYEAGRPLRSR